MNKVLTSYNRFIPGVTENRANELFVIAKKERRLEGADFRSNKWKLKGNELTDKATIIFPSELPAIVIMQMKCFIVELIHRRFSQSIVKKYYNVIKKTALFIKGDWSSVLNIDIDRIPNLQVVDSFALVSFLNYISEFELAAKVGYEIEEKSLYKKRGKRQLVDFKTQLILDYVFYDYFTDATICRDDLIYYYPLLIWWELGMIIPMRSTEYCAMKRQFVYERDGQNYCDLPVTKEKYSDTQAISYVALPVDEKLEKLVNNYCELVNEIDPHRKYLFSIKPYNRRHPTRGGKTRKYVDRNVLGGILNEFLQLVVEERYGIPVISKGEGASSGLTEYVERIQLGDIRHFAFYNMLKQGLDPLTIMMIARHKDINSQMAYTSGVETYSKSEVEVLAMMLIRRSKQRNINLEMAGILQSRHVILEQMRHEDDLVQQSNVELVDMDNCYCPKNHYIKDCPPNAECLICPYHVNKQDDEAHIAAVNQAVSDRATEELNDIVNVLKKMYITQSGERTPRDLVAIKALQPAINACAIAMMNKMEIGDVKDEQE